MIDQMQMEDYGGIYCTSCDISCGGRSWGHSHLLPKGRFPSFATKMWNISPRCQDWGNHKGCHEALDRGDFETIKDFKDLDQIMETLAQHEISTYNKFVSGLISVGCEKYSYINFEN